MTDLSKIFKPYERKARLYPALLLILPLILSVSLNFPELYSDLIGFVALAASFGVLHLLANLARDAGKSRESELFSQWGGMPSVSIFRFSNSTLSKPSKVNLHKKLEQLTEISAPTEAEEKANTEGTDQIYLSWSDYLRTNSRDQAKHPLLFDELTNYGFRRNVYGLRWFYGGSGAASLLLYYLTGNFTSEVEIGFMVITAIYSLYFIRFTNSRWVKATAVEYAKRLIETVM